MPIRLSSPPVRAAFSLALVVIFILAMIPMAVVPEVVSFQDKLHHATAFATLTVLGWAGWPRRPARIAAGLLAYGILIELCQHYLTTNRVGEALDVVADSAGILIGWLIVRGLPARLRAPTGADGRRP